MAQGSATSGILTSDCRLSFVSLSGAEMLRDRLTERQDVGVSTEPEPGWTP